ncbi:FtsQ-type POTRA domain-containing protein [Deinococcus sp. HMF7604]|uniref:cell division protein FtsQ/DivIB n=1 Tax=Deinococcus betulae TaxID=2873312 RepID=UPI001CC9F453|nr:FtsQ-type POTRA domain-containing protein [Deinococcus betulae]
MLVPDLIFPAATPDPEPPARPARRRLRRRWWGLILTLLLVGAALGLWFGLPIRTVTVDGNVRLSPARVQALAGLSPDFGWLYYGAWRARGLLGSPWVQAATVTRTFPDAVHIQLTERTAYARLRRLDGVVVAIAADGTVLPGALNTAKLPLISGWGPDRLPEMLRVLRALSRYNVQSVAYSPTGLTLTVAGKEASSRVWTGDVQALLKYAESISMYPNHKISIYPWGVSVQE